MTALGEYIDEFDVTVCDIFEAKVHNDQLCYEVDLDSYKDRLNIEKQLKNGLFLVIDYNEDRQFDRQFETEDNKKAKEIEIIRSFLKYEGVSAEIHLDSLGIQKVRKFIYIS